ncbi:hypothetical protein ACGFMM_16835 [Streptomyces sp. NPDC048604]|uniref:hypothetical protein n=1 Tax=Streptomyces sp. NPDC048604 TaxID=3365578 RepID=UPI0037110DAF
MGLPRRTEARTALRTALTVTVALGAATACSTAGGGEAAPVRTPTQQATTPTDLCTNLVAYWVKEALNGSKWAGLDWEQKGFSNEQFTLHDEVLAAARAKERTSGRKAALAFADEESRRRCAAANGATGSSENWRPPTSPPSR